MDKQFGNFIHTHVMEKWRELENIASESWMSKPSMVFHFIIFNDLKVLKNLYMQKEDD
jgi:hypothetical protein